MSGIEYEFKRDFKVGDKVFAYQKTQGFSARISNIYAYAKNKNAPLYITYIDGNSRATLSTKKEVEGVFTGDFFSLDDIIHYEDKEVWLKKNELNELLTQKNNIEKAINVINDELAQIIELKNSTLHYNGETYKMVKREPQAGDFMVYQEIEGLVVKGGVPYEVISIGGKLYIATERESENSTPFLLKIYNEGVGRTKENSKVYEKVSE